MDYNNELQYELDLAWEIEARFLASRSRLANHNGSKWLWTMADVKETDYGY